MKVFSHEECATYQVRMHALSALLKKKHQVEKGIILLCADFEQEREPFYQDSSFYYFTGINEPAVVYTKAFDGHASFYEPAYSIDRSVWVPLEYNKQYLQELNVNSVKKLGSQVLGYSIDAFAHVTAYENLIHDLTAYVNQGYTIFTPLKHVAFPVYALVQKLQTQNVDLKDVFVDCSYEVAALRRKKEQREIEYLYRAIEITAIAQEAAAEVIRPGRRESDIQAVIDYIYTEAQATRAFASVVGSGKNSTVLHYVSNTDSLHKGDLVVVDTGASFNHYCGDITRTYPVSGVFTERQKEVYSIVLETQKYIASLAKPGMWLNNKEHEEQSLNHLAKKYITERGYGEYFPHGIGHFVGLDVHDAGDYSKPLTPGDVITIEPGIYIPEESLGVRIEDMYWIVQNEAVCLSEGIIKEIDEIEVMMHKSLSKYK